MTRLGNQRVAAEDGNDLGDIDVLVADPLCRRLYALEAKSFSAGKTPYEMANERDNLFGEISEKCGAIKKHLRRVEWLESKIALALNVLVGDDQDAHMWHVVPFVVIDEDLFTPQLISGEMPVVTVNEFMDHLLSHR